MNFQQAIEKAKAMESDGYKWDCEDSNIFVSRDGKDWDLFYFHDQPDNHSYPLEV